MRSRVLFYFFFQICNNTAHNTQKEAKVNFFTTFDFSCGVRKTDTLVGDCTWVHKSDNYVKLKGSVRLSHVSYAGMEPGLQSPDLVQ